jgi:hypothetical protein
MLILEMELFLAMNSGTLSKKKNGLLAPKSGDLGNKYNPLFCLTKLPPELSVDKQEK